MTDAGQIIRMCRKHKNWSIVTLSVESTVSHSTIQEIETGLRDCRLSTFEKLLNTMGYELEVMKTEEP